ncbi:MATE family efflux transporter [Marinimicrobium alkaliphilum]|uniref:MATE family efflux transporter n=1 Tax=Marinimicrobium alkaliphilum TaxID=2202654 RepID=UPI001E5CB791|nr:MATE family efflux transporter [Marinimicrobium alkaliphilum]
MSNHLPRQFWLSVVILAIPVALQVLLLSLLGMADVMMVGTLGASAIAAVGLAAKIHFLLLVTMIGLGTGCSVLVAQYSGANNVRGEQRTLAASLLVGSVLMLPFTLLFGINPLWWVSHITPDPEVAALTARYLQITALVLLITQATVIFESALRALGNTTLPLIAAALSVVANVGLNYVLIFGHLGFPALGVEGAAWGTLIARMLQLVFLLIWLYSRNHRFAMRPRQLLTDAFARDHTRRYVRFATPLVINHVIWASGNATYHIVTGFAGTEALAVMGIIVPIETAFFALFNGMANASAVMIGRALGRDDHAQAWQLHKIFDRLVIGLVVVMSIGLFWLYPWLLKVFNQVDEQTTVLLKHTIWLFCGLVWIKVLNMVRIVGMLRAGGDNRFCLINDTIVMWVFGVPIFVAAVFLTDLPFQMLYFLMYVEDILKFIPARWRLGQRKWLKNLTRNDSP